MAAHSRVHAMSQTLLHLSKSLTTPTLSSKHPSWFLFASQAGPTQRIDCLVRKQTMRKVLFQGHKDAWPVRESNQEPGTFRSLIRGSTNQAVVAVAPL